MNPAVEAVGMLKSRGDFKEGREGWKAGSMAFHAFLPRHFHRAGLASRDRRLLAPTE